MKITVRHMRAAGMCFNGSRKFAIKHKLNWLDFLKNGIDSSILEKTGDAMALKVVGMAKNGRQFVSNRRV